MYTVTSASAFVLARDIYFIFFTRAMQWTTPFTFSPMQRRRWLFLLPSLLAVVVDDDDDEMECWSNMCSNAKRNQNTAIHKLLICSRAFHTQFRQNTNWKWKLKEKQKENEWSFSLWPHRIWIKNAFSFIRSTSIHRFRNFRNAQWSGSTISIVALFNANPKFTIIRQEKSFAALALNAEWKSVKFSIINVHCTK